MLKDGQYESTQKWPKKMDHHLTNQEFIYLFSNKKTLRKMKSISLHSSVQNSSISLRTRHIKKMKSKESISRTCNAHPTFSQKKHLKEESQKDDALKKCRSSNSSKLAIRRCQGGAKLK